MAAPLSVPVDIEVPACDKEREADGDCVVVPVWDGEPSWLGVGDGVDVMLDVGAPVRLDDCVAACVSDCVAVATWVCDAVAVGDAVTVGLTVPV